MLARHLEELALFALPRIEMDDAEDDDKDVFDARASISESGVALDTANSSDHSDHSTLQFVKDDKHFTGTGVQMGPRSDVESDEYSDIVEREGDTWNVVYRDVQMGPRSDVESDEYSDIVEREGDTWNVVYHDGDGPPESASKPRTSNQQHPSGEAPRPEGASPAKEKDKPIKFKGVIGRRFRFPFDLVNTWSVCTLGPRPLFQTTSDVVF